MKKILLVVLTSLLLLSTAAALTADTTSPDDPDVQIEPDYDPMYLPLPNTSVTVTTRAGRTLPYLRYTGNETPGSHTGLSQYPSATWVAGASNYYNCHAFAFTFRGSVSGYPSSYRLWLQDPGALWGDSACCYEAIIEQKDPTKISSSSVQVGDIVVWHYLDEQASMNEGTLNGSYPHSGIISKKKNGKIYVKSKWGEYPVYEHELNDHPWAFEIIGGGYNHGPQERRPVTVLRPKHAVDISINPALGKYLVNNSSTHYLLCADCGRKKVGTEAHTFIQYGSIRKCSKCGYQDAPINSNGGQRHDND